MADTSKGRTRWSLRRQGAAPTASVREPLAQLAILPVLSLHHLPVAGGEGPLHAVTDALLAALRYHAAVPMRRVLLGALAPRSGTTSLALHLALELARRGEQVTLLETNFAHPTLAALTGRAATLPGLSELLAGAADVEAARHRSPHLPTLEIIAAGATAHRHAAQGSEAPLFPPDGRARFETLLGELERQGRTVIVDGPCLLDEEAIIAAVLVGTVVVVETPEPLPIGANAHVRDRLQRGGATIAGAVYNPHTACPAPPPPLLDLRASGRVAHPIAPAVPPSAPPPAPPERATMAGATPYTPVTPAAPPAANGREKTRVPPPIPDGMDMEFLHRLQRHLGLG